MANPPAKAKARALELRDLLERANRAYYTDARPIMPDAEFDRLLVELDELERLHPELDDPASPTKRVGGEPIKGFNTVTHAAPMLSIDNTYTEDDVREWYARVRKSLGVGGGGLFDRDGAAGPTLVCDPKIDGVALSLRYEKGVLIHAVTRGDGTAGDDVTHVARTVRTIPLALRAPAETGAKHPPRARLPSEIPEVLEIRGEIYLPLKEFARLNKEKEAAGEDLLMNPRNAAAGALKQLDPKIAAQRRLAFSPHGRGEIVAPRGSRSPFASAHSAFLDAITALGVPKNPHTAVVATIDDALRAIEKFNATRRTLDYATDGMVIRVDSFEQQEELGTTSKSPRWVIAFKYPADRKTTRLRRVEHQVGKTGKITPRAIMEPVLLAGTTVQHATLHNYGWLRKLRTDMTVPEEKDPGTHLCLGDTVEIEKAGEIIPYVVRVLLEKRPKGAKKVEAPEKCPECGGPVEVEYDGDRKTDIDRWPKLPQFIKRDTKLLVQTEDPERREQISRRLARDKANLAAGIPPPPLGPDDETGRYCLNPECPAQFFERLVWFAGRKQMDIAGLGEQTVDQIRRQSKVPLNTFADIFRLKDYREELIALERMGEKKVDNLLAGIEAAKSRGLAKVLAGLGIRHVGDVTAKMLSRQFKDIDHLLTADERMLSPKTLTKAEADELGFAGESTDRPETGLGKGTVKTVHAYLQSTVASRMFSGLRSCGVDLTSREYKAGRSNTQSTGPLTGKIFVITGTLTSYEREDLKEVLESLGAKVSGAVSKKTSVLIVGENAGSKLVEAKKIGTEIWDEPRVLIELKNLGVSR